MIIITVNSNNYTTAIGIVVSRYCIIIIHCIFRYVTLNCRYLSLTVSNYFISQTQLCYSFDSSCKKILGVQNIILP